MCEVRSWIRRGRIAYARKQIYYKNRRGAALGDPKCTMKIVMNVGAGPVSARNLQLFFYDFLAGTEPRPYNVCNELHLRFRTVPFCFPTKEGQSLESFTQITIFSSKFFLIAYIYLRTSNI